MKRDDPSAQHFYLWLVGRREMYFEITRRSSVRVSGLSFCSMRIVRFLFHDANECLVLSDHRQRVVVCPSRLTKYGLRHVNRKSSAAASLRHCRFSVPFLPTLRPITTDIVAYFTRLRNVFHVLSRSPS